jgi:phosphatidate cytidylyltransferase
MLNQRITTAVIFAILAIISILYLPLIGFRVLAGLIVSLAAWEFAGLMWQKNYKIKAGFLAVFLLVVVLAQFFPAQPTLIVGGLWWLVVPYFLWCYTVDKSNYFTNIGWQCFVGIMVFVPCLIGLIEIQERFGPRFLFYLLAIVCAADIGAYFTGMFLGKHLLAYQISPKKTYEGVLGGLLSALIVTIIGALFLLFGIISTGGVTFNFGGMRGVSLLTLVIITCLWSVIGDLFESMLKRQAGVKDSGQLLPGHGGMYDRIDSLTAAIPIFVLGLLLI